jgi:MFS transporter, FLVCR family, feline leukemia virus subgroup C receptor-related protein
MLSALGIADEFPPGYANRWRSLAAFLVALILTQTFWFNFAPLLPMLAARYGVTELTASYTVLVFSLSNILLSSFAGMVIDSRGFRFAVLLGLVGMSAFACLRILDESFWVLLAAQAGISAFVPFTFVAIPQVVADLFPAKDGPRINGICSIGVCIGSSSSLWLSPRIILGMGFRPSMILFAGMVVVWSIVFALFVPRAKSGTARQAGRARTTQAQTTQARATQPREHVILSSVVDLFRIRSLTVLFAIGFLGHGIFTCVTTWIGTLWHEHGISTQSAGMGGSMLIIGGIVGCLAVPNLLSRYGSYRVLLWAAFVPCIFLVTPFLWATSPVAGLVWGGLMGFCYLSMMPTVYSMLAHYAPPHRLGAASGLYLMISSIGGIVVTICFRLLKDAGGWRVATGALIATLLTISVLVALIRDASPLVSAEAEMEAAA